MPRLTVPIYADGDRERLRELKAAVDVAERNANEARKEAAKGVSLRGGDPVPTEGLDEAVKAAEVAYDAFLDEAAERAEGWVLDHIGFREFRELLKAHPPRTTTEVAEDGSTKEIVEPIDKAFGVNVEEFPYELLLFVDKDDPDIRTVVELKQGKTNIARDTEKLRKRVKRLSEGQFDDLWQRAYWLNKAGVNDPKLERYSPVIPRSSET